MGGCSFIPRKSKVSEYFGLLKVPMNISHSRQQTSVLTLKRITTILLNLEMQFAEKVKQFRPLVKKELD